MRDTISAGAPVIGSIYCREGKEAFEEATSYRFAGTCGGSCKMNEKEG